MVRNIRLLNEVDRELELINKDLYVESVIRPFLGKSYPVDFKRQKKIWDLLMSKRVGMAKRARSIELNRIKRGRGSTKNVDRLDKIINELTERRKEFL